MVLAVHLLACIFGMGSWIAINGLWVELPLIVNVLPEGWDLPSYLTIIIQLANVGPLSVTLMHKFAPGKLKEVVAIYVILSIGLLASLLLVFLWKETTLLAGQLHSTAFLILTFFLSLVDCTSSVTFLPFMMRLHTRYMTTYFIGEGLSGFVPGLVAIGQGAGMIKCVNISKADNGTTGNLTAGAGLHQVETHYVQANFTTETFLVFLTAMMVVCLVAFVLLTRVALLPRGRPGDERTSARVAPVSTVEREMSKYVPKGPGDVQDPSLMNLQKQAVVETQSLTATKLSGYSRHQLLFLYLLVLWVNSLTNGFLPSVQSYSCLPYGNTAYHLSAALSSMANPVACVIALILPNR